MSNITINFNGEKKALSELIKSEALSQTEAQKAIDKIYAEVPAVQKSFGQTVEEIMITQGLVKKWGKRTILDVNEAARLTGLNADIFRVNMFKPNCAIDMGLVVSICIGFKIGSILTNRLLTSAGLEFRLSNPEHLAYIFLLEHCNDLSVYECNEILEYLGVPQARRLGSYHKSREKVEI